MTIDEPEEIGEVETIEIVSRQTPQSKPRGLAAMTPEKRREIAQKGGKAAQAKGTGRRFTSAEAREAGRKGGAAHTREHLAEIGRKGGFAVSTDRKHMAEIGRKGGEVSAKGKPE